MNSEEMKTRRTALSEEADGLYERKQELQHQQVLAEKAWRESRINALIDGTPEPKRPKEMADLAAAVTEVDLRVGDVQAAIKSLDHQISALVHEERRAATAELDRKLRPQLNDLAAAARAALAKYSAAHLLASGMPTDKACPVRAAELCRGDRATWAAAVQAAVECLR